MIPIRDHQGRVVAFTARQTELTPADDPAREAKYVNSPETPIFTKSNLLFNLDRARSHVGEGHPFVIVEGQLDALRCWSVGLKTAIAPQGTSITEGQLVLLRRYHTQVECFFDSDSAGQKAALRFLPMALKAGLEVRFLTLAGASKLDPDLLFLERGLPAYAEVRRGAQSAMTFACRATLPDPANATSEHKTRAAQTLYELIAAGRRPGGPLAVPVRSRHPPPPRPSRPSPPISAPAITAKTAQAASRPSPADRRAGPRPRDRHRRAPPPHALPSTTSNSAAARRPHDPAQVDGCWVISPATLLNRVLAEFEQNSWPGREHLNSLLETAEERTLVATLHLQRP